MTALDPVTTPAFRTPTPRAAKRAFAIAAAVLAAALALDAAPAAAIGTIGNVDIRSRPDGRALPVYYKEGRHWIVGTPGREYGIQVCNSTGGRVLTVMSVDGVNVVSGDTASPAQSGYVLDAYQCADINGWRKSLAATAAFYFTELPDAYAARTGRPENVGVIGVAFFRERTRTVLRNDALGSIVPGAAGEATPRSETPSSKAAADSAAAGGAMAQREAAQSHSAPAPLAKIGTGHGREETSYVQTTRFERASSSPDETVVIHYDRRDNLIAMGVLPPPAIARSPNPFPSWTPRFVPDPPSR